MRATQTASPTVLADARQKIGDRWSRWLSFQPLVRSTRTTHQKGRGAARNEWFMSGFGAMRDLRRARCAICLRLAQQILQVERLGDHRERAIRIHRPLLARTVPVQLNPVAIGVGEIDRLADAMIARALKRNLRRDEATQPIGQRRAGRIENRDVIEPGGALWRGWGAFAVPRVQPDVM